MIALVIAAILASIAVPSYRQYVLRSHRVEATSALLRVAAAQEKFYLQNNTYTDNVGVVDGLAFSADDDTASFITENGWYEVTVTAADVDSFTLKAEPAGRPGRRLGSARVSAWSSTGVKSASGEKCWK